MLPLTSVGLRINDLLGQLGIPGGQIGAQIDMLSGNPLGALRNLQDAYTEAAIGRGTNGLERQFGPGAGGCFQPFGAYPPPAAMLPQYAPVCGSGYSAQRVDLGGGASNAKFFGMYMNPQRRAAAKFERLLNSNPAARAAFEQSVGGHVRFDGRNDGRITIERFTPGFMPIGAGLGMNPLAMQANGILGGLQFAAQSQLGSLAGLGLLGAGAGALGGALLGGNPFHSMLLGGLTGVAGGLLGGPLGLLGGGPLGMLAGIGGGGLGGGIPGGLFGFGGNAGPFGGAGMGSWNPSAAPGQIQNTNPLYERAHQAQVASVLNDPSLTVEDKVTLMIMMIMKKMDKDIENQSQYINSIQQQQSNRQGGKKGGGGGKKGGGAGSNGAPSIDVETMKLKRMIDKRGQMFDMLRQIIDKYNETAKGIIQSIGR